MCQMALQAEQLPFKVSDMIRSIERVDLEKTKSIPLRKMTTKKWYRHEWKYKMVFFNPHYLRREPSVYVKKYDRDIVLKHLLINCNEVGLLLISFGGQSSSSSPRGAIVNLNFKSTVVLLSMAVVLHPSWSIRWRGDLGRYI